MAVPCPWLNPFFIVTNVDSDAYVNLTYTIGENATQEQNFDYFRGSGVALRFEPIIPETIDLSQYTLVIGAGEGDSSPLQMTEANGGLDADGINGAFFANPTAAQSAVWSLIETVWELWRTTPDDSRTIEAFGRIKVKESMRPS